MTLDPRQRMMVAALVMSHAHRNPPIEVVAAIHNVAAELGLPGRVVADCLVSETRFYCGGG